MTSFSAKTLFNTVQKRMFISESIGWKLLMEKISSISIVSILLLVDLEL